MPTYRNTYSRKRTHSLTCLTSQESHHNTPIKPYLSHPLSLSLKPSPPFSFSKTPTMRRQDNSIASIGSSVIPIINKLQDIFAPIGGGGDRDLYKVQLPQVVVIGSQSSGKSSVLEALVGRDFLPRGCDICTRRPLVLQLENRPVRSDSGDDGLEEWGEFRHLPGKRFYVFSKIRQVIKDETEREVGYNKRVSDKQIRLKISSPNVLNITLVDLPGITKVPVGDQPSDIEERIRKMIMLYIKQEACIILAVSPANSDLATSDALQMAKEADPAGSRTIGVITKLDIMDRGTNARNFLLGKVVPLRLGYVGVVNRSQELAKKLNQILEQHIRTVLPRLKAELNSHLLNVVKELRTYGEAMESKAEQGVVLLNILTKYCETFSAMVDGKSQEMSTKELIGGARINYIFQSIFVKRLEEVDPCEDLTDEDVRTAMQNATGPKNALFVPEVPFEVLIRRQIARLFDPSLQCLQLVYDELIKMSRACEAMEIQRFPALRQQLDEVIGKFLRDGVKPAERMIGNLIEIEMDYINSSHPNFIGGNKAVELAMQQLRSSQDAKDVEKVSASERGQKSRAAQAKSVLNGVLPNQGSRPQPNDGRPVPVDNSSTRTWGISSIFGSRASPGESSVNSSFDETVHDSEQMPSLIQLREPPAVLRPPETRTDNEAVEVRVTKLLLRSYYDIVRKNIQDLVPKSIMHFLVNNTKRDLLSTFIQKLYRDSLFEEMLQEHDEVVVKRKQTREMFHVLQQAVQTLDEVVADVSSRGSSSSTDTTTGLPRTPDLSPHHYSTSNGKNGHFHP